MPRRLRPVLLASTALAVVLHHAPPAATQNLPTAPQVVSGQVGVSQPSATQMVVTQTTPTGIVNWGSFSIGQGYRTHFDNATGATLNRVTGTMPSSLNGLLTATGSVYLVNPAGIVVGPTGEIRTGGHFVGSTLDIRNEDFLRGGDLTLRGDSTASVVNLGTIGSSRGDVILVAHDVANHGAIAAPRGTAGLASGREVLIRDQSMADGKIAVRVGAPGGSVTNTGNIRAAEAELRANGGNVHALAVNTKGAITATGVRRQGGRIFLTAEGGTVTVSQTLRAQKPAAAPRRRADGALPKARPVMDGGAIAITGETVRIEAGALIDVSGARGGTVAIGGDFQGGINPADNLLAAPLANATTTTIAAGATIRANGTAGDGGKVVVWADELTSFHGAISATGMGAGVGGFAEVSGKRLLDFAGAVDLTAQSGHTGTLLLDPYNVVISTGSDLNHTGFTATGDDSVINAATLIAALGSANVIVSTGAGGGQDGNITMAAPVFWSTGTTLTLQAAGDIFVNADITATGNNAGLVLSHGAGRGYSLNNGAAITLSGANPSLSIGGQSYTVIQTLGQLQDMQNGLAGHYALGVDINAAATASWNGGFAPVGNDATPFIGAFDGLGHVISGLVIDRPSTNTVGLFGATQNATIANVGLEGGSVRGNERVGGLVGWQWGGSIDRSWATGAVNGQRYVGGLVGWQQGGSIAQSYATGAVNGGFYVGGLVGTQRDGSIDRSYATGAVDGGFYVGGLVGSQAQGGSIASSYATGAVTGIDYVGGLVGFQGVGSISASFFDATTTGLPASQGVGNIANAPGVTAIQSDDPNGANYAFNQATYAGLDFSTDWFMIGGETRPFGRWEHSTTIRNAHQLQLMAMDLGASYRLAGDINLGAALADPAQMWKTAASGSAQHGFVPVGDIASRFTGSFDGQGHVVSGLVIDRPSTDYVGLFGFAQNATIANVDLEGVSVRGRNTVGGLVGYLWGGSSITHSTVAGHVQGTERVGGLAGQQAGSIIAQSTATGRVDGFQIVGGLVGYQWNSSSIAQSTATGQVAGSYEVGGLVGFQWNSSIAQSHATGAVSGIDNVGGLVGYQDSGSIAQSWAIGTVTGTQNVGGLVGYQDSGSIAQSWASGAVMGTDFVGGLVGWQQGGSIAQSYANGAVTGTQYIGGLVGFQDTGTITAAYWDTETTGQSQGVGLGSQDGTAALTTAQLQAGLPAGFDPTVWGILPGVSYPYHLWRFPDGPSVVSGTVAGVAGGNHALGVQVAAAGAVVGSTHTGANGYYHLMLDPLGSAPVLSFLDGTRWAGATVPERGNAVAMTAATDGRHHAAGLDIGAGFVSVFTGRPSYSDTVTGLMAPARDGLDHPGILYSADGTLVLAAAAGLRLDTAAAGFLLDSDIAAGGGIRLTGSGSYAIPDGATLALASTAGAISIEADLVAPDSALSIAGVAGSTAAVEVRAFRLLSGAWTQNDATLPAFSAGDFRIEGGSFLRAAGGAGTAGDPYMLADVFGLQGMGTHLSAHFALANDIHASGTTGWWDGAGFVPVGNNATQFTGAFDGQGHVVSGLVIDRPSTNYVGLFGVTQNATIANVGLDGGSIRGNGFIGGLVGWQQSGGSITSSSATGAVNGQILVGGLVGYLEGGSIVQSWATGAVTGAGSSSVGGLVGQQGASSSITSSHATGAVTGTQSVGGLVGLQAGGSIAQSTATGAVTGTERVGGLVGYQNGSIDRSTATGAVNGQFYVGGLVGWQEGSIDRSTATGAVTATSGTIGGLVGWQASGSIDRSTATGVVIGQANVGGLVGWLASGSIDRSTASGAVMGTGNLVGGLVGWQLDGSIDRSYATGAVNGNLYVGGLIGFLSGGSIDRSYATGAVIGQTYVGGLVGTHRDGSIGRSYATGAVNGQIYVGGLAGSHQGGSIDRTYATGTVNGQIYVGGLVGFQYTGSITGSFFDTTTTGLLASQGVGSIADAPGVTGLTTAQFQNTAGFMTLAQGQGWDFETVWAPPSAGFHPELYALSPVVRVDVASDSRLYGDANATPVETGRYGGAAAYAFGPAGDTLAFAAGLQWTAARTGNVGVYGATGLSSAVSAEGVTYRIVHTGALTVDPRVVTVTALGGTSVYGDTPSNPGLSATNLAAHDTVAALTGLTNSFGIGATTGAGNHTLTVEGALTNPNYTVSGTVGGTWTVTPRPITFSATDQARLYGDANSALTFNPAIGGSGLAAHHADLAAAGFGLTTTADAQSDVGGYAITQTGTNANYAVTFTAGTLTVNPAPLTITANDATKQLGEPLTFTGSEFTATGLMLGQSVGSVALTSAGAAASAGMGPYAIVASNAGGGTFNPANYIVTYVNGTLSVVEATLTSLPLLTPYEPGMVPPGFSTWFLSALPASGSGDEQTDDATVACVDGQACQAWPHPDNRQFGQFITFRPGTAGP